jgi:DNA-binding HxlR family transcriptional regulator
MSLPSAPLDYSQPFQVAIELIGRRWSGSILRALLERPMRFNELLTGIPQISDQVLTERLRELDTAGLVERLVHVGPPVRVAYRLTDRGKALRAVVAAVDEWIATASAERREHQQEATR